MEEENQEKCIRQSALSVAKNVKFRSNLTEADPYTAENAMQREDPQEEIDIKLTIWLPILRSQSLFFLSFLLLRALHRLRHSLKAGHACMRRTQYFL